MNLTRESEKKTFYKNLKLMNILKTIRKPFLAVLFAFLILFVSCTQYDPVEIKEQNFDYTAFNDFKSQGYRIDINHPIKFGY